MQSARRMWFVFIDHLIRDIEYMFDNGHDPVPFSTNGDLFRGLGSWWCGLEVAIYGHRGVHMNLLY